jgi:hypothetical protein
MFLVFEQKWVSQQIMPPIDVIILLPAFFSLPVGQRLSFESYCCLGELATRIVPSRKLRRLKAISAIISAKSQRPAWGKTTFRVSSDKKDVF